MPHASRWIGLLIATMLAATPVSADIRTPAKPMKPPSRAIKLDQAVATPASRVATAAALAEIATKIERLRGITVEAACLDNPLAATCT